MVMDELIMMMEELMFIIFLLQILGSVLEFL